MATLQLGLKPDNPVVGKQPGIVYTASSWTGEWTEQRDCVPLAAELRAAPGISTGSFVYHYGVIKRPDRTGFSEYWPPDLVGQYVRFAVPKAETGTPVCLPWAGIVTGVEHGVQGPVGASPQGDCLYSCRGLEHLLEQARLDRAWAEVGGVGVRLGRCPVFNERYARGGTPLGNRTTAAITCGSVQSHAFSTQGAVWTNLDIVRYVLALFAPTLSWTVEGETALLHQLTGVYDLEGYTVWQALNALIDRRRGLLWSLRAEPGDAVVVHVSSVYDQAVRVGDAKIDPNPETARLELYGAGSPGDCLTAEVRVSEADVQHYGRIEVVGERMRSTFTLSYASGKLLRAWQPATMALYTTGLGDDPDANDKYRALPLFEDVFCGFRVSPTWDFVGDNGEGVAGGRVAPKINDDGSLDTGADGGWWRGDKAPLNLLPWQEAADDEGVHYARPFACVQDPETGGFVLTHKHAIPGVPAAGLLVHDHELRVRLNPPYNHLFGRGYLTAAHGPTLEVGGLSDTGDHFSFETLLVTLQIELDERCRVVATVADGDPARVLTVRVRDAHLWYVSPKTVTGVNSNGTLARHAGGTVRDDKARLQLVAAMAVAWYGRRRQRLRYAVRELGPIARPGTFIEAVESVGWTEPISTVCTRMSWDFESGTSSLETDFWELDFAAADFDQPGTPGGRALARVIDGVVSGFSRSQEEA